MDGDRTAPRGVAVVLEEGARMLTVVQQSVVRQIRDRGMHTDREYKSPVPYLRDLLRISESEAAARVQAVERFHPRVGMSGEVLPPFFPEVAAAVAGGVISMQHASVIAGALRKLPAAVEEPERVAAEEALVHVATELDPGAVKRAGKHLCAVLDPDGVLATEREQRERQEFSLVPDLHGMYRLRGRLDASTANVVNLAVEALAKPCPSADGTPDPRPRPTAAPTRSAGSPPWLWTTRRCRPPVDTVRRSSRRSRSPSSSSVPERPG